MGGTGESRETENHFQNWVRRKKGPMHAENPPRNPPNYKGGQQQQHPFLAAGKEAFTEPRGMER